MFESIMKFFKRRKKSEETSTKSKEAAKERLHLVLMQDRANVSVDFLELMKQEIIDVIKKYIEVDDDAIDVRLTNKENEDGTTGAPALYANIPILNIKNDTKKEIELEKKEQDEQQQEESKKEVEDVKKEEIESETVKDETVENESNENNIKTEKADNKNNRKKSE